MRGHFRQQMYTLCIDKQVIVQINCFITHYHKTIFVNLRTCFLIERRQNTINHLRLIKFVIVCYIAILIIYKYKTVFWSTSL